MADTRRVSQPSQGTEDLGRETPDARGTTVGSGGGSDAQLHIAAKSGNKSKDTNEKNNANDDEKVLKNGDDNDEWLSNDETDE